MAVDSVEEIHCLTTRSSSCVREELYPEKNTCVSVSKFRISEAKSWSKLRFFVVSLILDRQLENKFFVIHARQEEV